MSSADPAMMLLESLKDGPEEVPEGWKTAIEWGEVLGFSRPHTNRLIGDAVRAGKWEVRKFRIRTANRGLYLTPHYRPVE